MFLDILVVLLFTCMVSIGVKLGLVRMAARLIKLVLGVIFAYVFAPVIIKSLMGTPFYQSIFNLISDRLSDVFVSPDIQFGIFNNLIAPHVESAARSIQVETAIALTNGVITLVVFVVFSLLLSLAIPLLDSVLKLPVLNVANKIGGVVLGTLYSLVIVYLVVISMHFYNTAISTDWINQQLESSVTARIIINDVEAAHTL